VRAQEGIPDGTTTIEGRDADGRLRDASEKKIDFYWRNADLSPAARPKGGAK